MGYNWKLKWVEELKCMHNFWDVKKKKKYIYIYIYIQMDAIFNIKQVEMNCVTFVST